MNALLYILGGLALIFLITTLFSDDNPRQIQVGAGAAATSSTRASSSTVPPTTATTSTTVRPSTTAVATTTATTARASTGGTSSNSGQTAGGGVGDGADGAESGTTTTPPPEPCRNSTEPRCGDFRWDPQPAGNRAPTFSMPAQPISVPTGSDVTFFVDVQEPDHLLDDACAIATFGDGTASGGCPPPPCPERYGPWDTPAAVQDAQRFAFHHKYTQPGTYTFTVHLDSRDDCKDPYGSSPLGDGMSPSVVVNVVSPTGGT